MPTELEILLMAKHLLANGTAWTRGAFVDDHNYRGNKLKSGHKCHCLMGAVLEAAGAFNMSEWPEEVFNIRHKLENLLGGGEDSDVFAFNDRQEEPGPVLELLNRQINMEMAHDHA